MKTELIIRSNDGTDIDYALLRDGKLMELYKDEVSNDFAVGDIFLASIGKTLSGLNAAFVNVGHKKDGFLHYHDLGPQVNSLYNFIKRVKSGREKDFTLKNFRLDKDIHKDGNIDDVLKTKQQLLVQIVKEPISTKGPRLSSEISIAGRYLVLVPFSDRVSVSQKISNIKEKDRLKKLVRSIKPKGFGVIVRTVAQDKKQEELHKDLETSLERWVSLCKQIKVAKTPTKILGELNRTSSLLRDILNDSFTSIVTDNAKVADEVREYISEIAPEKESIVKLHKSQYPIFEKFRIERQIKTAFGKTVSMSKGAYLVIEHTEALHVIDVNSGNRSNRAKSQADTALEVNLIAATEIARQLQLRDMGGIIVVDFIDMHRAEDRQALFDHLKKQMKFDRTKHKVLPPTKFGLVQITRQRVRAELIIKTREENPSKAAEVEAPIAMVDKISNVLDRRISSRNDGKFAIHVHPFIAAYLKEGVPSLRMKWAIKHKKWIKIIPRDAYKYLEFRIKNENK